MSSAPTLLLCINCKYQGDSKTPISLTEYQPYSVGFLGSFINKVSYKPQESHLLFGWGFVPLLMKTTFFRKSSPNQKGLVTLFLRGKSDIVNRSEKHPIPPPGFSPNAFRDVPCNIEKVLPSNLFKLGPPNIHVLQHVPVQTFHIQPFSSHACRIAVLLKLL